MLVNLRKKLLRKLFLNLETRVYFYSFGNLLTWVDSNDDDDEEEDSDFEESDDESDNTDTEMEWETDDD
jgi:hypothetical protein